MSWSGTIDPKKPTGYEFAISRVLGVGGQKFKPSLSTEQVERVVKSSFFWTPSGVNAGILHFPSNEEKCVIIAQAFRSIPKLVEWAWFDRSEYMTADVRKILGNAKSSVPAAEEAPRPKKAAIIQDVEDDDDFSPPVSKKPAAPVRPANNQTFTDDDDDLDLPVLKKVAAPVVDDDDEDDAVVPTPIRPPVLDDDEDDAELSVPTKAAPVDEDDLEEGEADDADEFEEDGDDDDDMPPPPKSARNAPPKSPAPKPPRKK
jgi:hypothetical protein